MDEIAKINRILIITKAQYCPELNRSVRSLGHRGLRDNCLHVRGQTVNLFYAEVNCSGTHLRVSTYYGQVLSSTSQVSSNIGFNRQGQFKCLVLIFFPWCHGVPTVQWFEPTLKIRGFERLSYFVGFWVTKGGKSKSLSQLCLSNSLWNYCPLAGL